MLAAESASTFLRFSRRGGYGFSEPAVASWVHSGKKLLTSLRTAPMFVNFGCHVERTYDVQLEGELSEFSSIPSKWFFFSCNRSRFDTRSRCISQLQNTLDYLSQLANIGILSTGWLASHFHCNISVRRNWEGVYCHWGFWAALPASFHCQIFPHLPL